VGRGETIDLIAQFRTPENPGKYLLVLELFSGDYDWFSRIGVVPSLIQVDVQPGVSRSTDELDLSAFYHRGQMPRTFTASVRRLDLWKAGAEMFVAHPFGTGPDNYRLEYGKYIGAKSWDTRVYSNNLFLEILTGSGVLGLAAFLWFLIAIPRRFDRELLSVGIFLVHGLVDVFLMATPIYFAFWSLLGTHLSFHYTDTNPL
jgi:O-antigen ligase